MKIKYIFMAVKIACLYGVVFLSFHFYDMHIAAFISLFALLSVTIQKEETENEWLDYINEEE